MLVHKKAKRLIHLRLFLFHTALGSGAEPGFTPLAEADERGAESRSPLPVFATRRGLGVADTEGPAWTAAEPATDLFSPNFDGAVPVAPFDARNVLFTVTALKDVGFLTIEAVLTWPLSSTRSFELSPLEASVSEPPLILAAAEVDCTAPPPSPLSPSMEEASPLIGGGEIEGTS